MRFGIAIFISMILHLGLLVAVSNEGASGKRNGTEQASRGPAKVKINHIEKKSEVKQPDDTKIIPKKKDQEITKEKTKSPGQGDEKNLSEFSRSMFQCENYYIGIGVIIKNDSGMGCVLSEVYEGYPAWNNGLMPGDLIVGFNCGTLRNGPEGISFDLTIMRGVQVIRISLEREKICEDKSGNITRPKSVQ